MFKRAERKRKRREEEEDLGLDQDMKELMGLNDTDSDESDSASDSGHQSEIRDGTDADSASEDDEDRNQQDEAASEDGGVDEEPPMSVAQALKDPIYPISSDPTVHRCVLCKEKLIKSAGIAAAHKDANAHKRRFEQFRVLSATADPRSNAWELVRAIRSAQNMRRAEPPELSKRALKRQVKQGAIRGKRNRHKELKAKAIAKKALSKLSAADETRRASPPRPSSPVSQSQPEKARKKQKSERKTSANTIMETQDVKAKVASRTKPSRGSKKLILSTATKAHKRVVS